MELFLAFFILLGILMVIAAGISIAGARINQRDTPYDDMPRMDYSDTPHAHTHGDSMPVDMGSFGHHHGG